MCAVLLGVAIAPRGAEAQGSASAGQLRALGPLTAMSAEVQTRLALSSAPPEVSSRASVYVLGGAGYTRTRVGTNGFSCLIEREFLETVEPVCYDAEGSATTLLARLYREQLRARALSEAEVRRRIEAAYRAGRFRAPRKPGLVYMLAPEQRSWNPGTKSIFQAGPHFMLYAPFATQADVGGSLGPNMPVVVWPGRPDALIIVMALHDAHGR
ncbi:MAG TPA: hypothetical protein VFN38_14930 [Gemmatimonadaceae bacterium]|nr:hypothetical protein [Gemmatimonadaceae bacterium]